MADQNDIDRFEVWIQDCQTYRWRQLQHDTGEGQPRIGYPGGPGGAERAHQDFLAYCGRADVCGVELREYHRGGGWLVRGRCPDQLGYVPSARVVDQRVRNRVIDYLELAASLDVQRRLERDVPTEPSIPYELINEWQDNFPRDPRREELPSVYSSEEIAVIREFHAIWEVAADALPDAFPSVGDVQSLPAWQSLLRTAEKASAVFARRGRLPEDREVPET